MPIGDFGGAAALPHDQGFPSANPLYWLYEMGQAALNPARAIANIKQLMLERRG